MKLIEDVIKKIATNKRRIYLLENQIANKNINASAINIRLISGYKSYYNMHVKRSFDLVISIIALCCLLPVYIITAIAILIDSGVPVFYCAERGGYKGKNFKIYKFRSMIKDADNVGGGTTALNDKRITKIGTFIRKTKIDELPNLLNVIKGEMSIIGPRPELLKYTKKYKGAECFILEVRPGITDFSSMEFVSLDQIVGKEDVDNKYEKNVLPIKNKLRVKYAANVSFFTDVKIFLLTSYKVIKK